MTEGLYPIVAFGFATLLILIVVEALLFFGLRQLEKLNQKHTKPMNSEDKPYDGVKVACDPTPCLNVETVSTKMCREPNLTERLLDRRERLQRDLDEVNTALALLKKNKEVSETLNSITRVFGNQLR